ncbi:uncharacterized protein [Vulpes vulpes]|uniref:Uncharacterized protein n=1 Tax=Vulpes vulpes TaxID=9627 RepID=A0ABM4YCL4_VULVU
MTTSARKACRTVLEWQTLASCEKQSVPSPAVLFFTSSYSLSSSLKRNFQTQECKKFHTSTDETTDLENTPPAPRAGRGGAAWELAGSARRHSEAPNSRRFGRAAGSPASHSNRPRRGPARHDRAGPARGQCGERRPAGPRARLAHLSGCAAFLRRCRRLLPVSAAGSDLWNHHTSPARRCSAAAAPPPPPPPQPPLFVPPSSATASAAPTGHRYALPPPRPPASPSSLRPLPPSPPRRRRRLHRRRRLLLRAPLVFIESKQASWRRPPSPSQRAPGRRRRSNIPAAHWPPLPGATIRCAAGCSLLFAVSPPFPRPPSPSCPCPLAGMRGGSQTTSAAPSSAGGDPRP